MRKFIEVLDRLFTLWIVILMFNITDEIITNNSITIGAFELVVLFGSYIITFLDSYLKRRISK